MLDLNKITFGNYQEACLKFAEDSKDWGGLGDYFYTNSGSDWVESSDNSQGGFDLKWCFKLSINDIKARCRNEYIKILKENLNLAIDSIEADEWDRKEAVQFLNWCITALE